MQKRRPHRNGFGHVVSAVDGALEFRRTVVFIRDMDHDLRKKDTLRMDFSFYTAERAPLLGHYRDTVSAFAAVPSLHL